MSRSIDESTLLAGLTHLPGRLRLAFSPSGDYIYTGSSGDNIVRIHNARALLTSEPTYLDEIERETTWIETVKSKNGENANANEGMVLVSSEDGVVRMFSGENGKGRGEEEEHAFQGILTRAAGVPSRCLAVDGRGERVAVCSDETIVKIISLSDPSSAIVLPNITKHVRSASWNPHPSARTMLTVLLSDGKLMIFDFLESESSIPTCLKTIDGLVSSGTAESDLPALVAWHPSGDFFVVPSRTHEIAIVDRDSWTKSTGRGFSEGGHDSEVGILVWSPNGRFLASSGRDGNLILWETNSRKPVTRTKVNGKIITDLRWSPVDNSLVYGTVDGGFFLWEEAIPAEYGHPAQINTSKARQHQTNVRNNAGAGEQGIAQRGDDAFFDDVDAGIDGQGRDEEHMNGLGGIEDGQGEDIDLDMDEYDDDWIIDKDDDHALGYKAGKGGKADEGWASGMREVVSVTKAQAPFQPGATAMKDKRRYLAFNMIGVVEVTDVDTHHVVNVEFHDKIARRGYHFQDTTRFQLAAIGDHGIVYASEAEEGSPSVISYRAYDAWASQSDWQASLPDGEQAVVVAVGGRSADPDDDIVDVGMGSVIVATSRGYLRFFSGSGLQRYLWKTGEDVISMVASQDMVFIAHREGGTSLDGCQNLRYTLIHLDNFDIVQEGRLPLPKKTTLTWVGFASNGSPVIYDSAGQLSILDRYKRQGQARWSPFLDSNTLARRKGKLENYWPVGVTETQLMCLILKGGQLQPGFPRPLIMDVDVNLPLLNMDVSQGQAEERYLRTSLQLGCLKDTLIVSPTNSSVKKDINSIQIAQDKELLQMMQTACQADKLQRALDLARLLQLPATLDAAMKLAGFYKFPGLQDKIRMVKESMLDGRGRRRSDRPTGFIRNEALPFSTSNGLADSRSSAANDLTEFAPRPTSARRTAPARPTNDDEMDRSMSYIPDTPQESLSVSPVDTRDDSPPYQSRKRRIEDTIEFDEFESFDASDAGAKRVNGSKQANRNPFARREPATKPSNPFARPAVNSKSNQPLGKSTSFFERVDDIEGHKGLDGKKAASKSKQTTLTGMMPVKQKRAEAVGKTTAELEPAVDAIEESDNEETQVDKRAQDNTEEDGAGSDAELGEEEWPASDVEEEAETGPRAASDEEAEREPVQDVLLTGRDKLAKFRATVVK